MDKYTVISQWYEHDTVKQGHWVLIVRIYCK